MRKKAFITIILISCCCTLFAGWLDDVANTVDTVNKVVNPEKAVKTTIGDLQNSENKYINRKVQVTGKVMGLAVVNDDTFAVFVQDNGGKVKVIVKNNPYCRLLDNITVTGIYNGDGLVSAYIN